jgi:hypothetical protein
MSTMPFIRGRTDDDQKEKPALFKFYDFTMGKFMHVLANQILQRKLRSFYI